MKIIPIDCQYTHSSYATAYLLIEGSEAAFIETNTNHAVSLLLAELKKQGLSPEQVKWIAVTHVHLDHAGGASLLMAQCPDAVLYAHPRAAKHLIDPSRLIASAEGVYGKEKFRALYGDIQPIAAARVHACDEGAEFNLGQYRFQVLHTRGHANHHFCLYEAASGAVFTGDTFGICYPAMQKMGLFIFPSTSPTDFNAAEAQASIQRILALNPQVLYLTHFGALKDIKAAAQMLMKHLEFSEKLRLEVKVLPEAQRMSFCHQKLNAYYADELKKMGWILTESEQELLALDFELNAQGLCLARD